MTSGPPGYRPDTWGLCGVKKMFQVMWWSCDIDFSCMSAVYEGCLPLTSQQFGLPHLLYLALHITLTFQLLAVHAQKPDGNSCVMEKLDLE